MMLHLEMSGLLVIVGIATFWTTRPGSCLPNPARSSSAFYVINNSSIPCQELSIVAPDIPRVALSDEQMMEMFVSRGGVYIPTYMARSRDEASRQFPSLLDIPRRFKDRVVLNKALERVRHERVTKDDIASYMRSHWRPREPLQSSSEVDDVETSEQETRPERLAKRRHRREIDDPEVVGYIADDLLPEDDIFPLVLPSDLGMAGSYTSSDGSQTNISYCDPRGSDATHNTQTLCTACSATTTLGEDRWPPELNELLCAPEDMDCLVAQGTAQGLCRQNSVEITALCKKEGYCSLALQDGQTVIVDEWEMCYQQIRVGCECTVFKTSFFSNFV